MIENSSDKHGEVLRTAMDMFDQGADWVAFFREILGVDGLIRRAFPDSESLGAFEQSVEYDTIQHMLGKLRLQVAPANDSQEPTRVITVRLPQSVHESIRNEAHERRTSMNKLCISKLIQVIDEELVPAAAS